MQLEVQDYEVFTYAGPKRTRLATWDIDEIPGCCGYEVFHSLTPTLDLEEEDHDEVYREIVQYLHERYDEASPPTLLLIQCVDAEHAHDSSVAYSNYDQSEFVGIFDLNLLRQATKEHWEFVSAHRSPVTGNEIETWMLRHDYSEAFDLLDDVYDN